MMEKKVKLGVLIGFLGGVAVAVGVAAWYYYPKYQIDSAMQTCNAQFGLGPDGAISEEALAKYPSQQAFETAYTSCVNGSLQ